MKLENYCTPDGKCDLPLDMDPDSCSHGYGMHYDGIFLMCGNERCGQCTSTDAIKESNGVK